ncbi:MAG: 30S ribosomal protein S19 [Candidatus Argoarchaeum ethanivorans]|uniref:Small ribosomal subunit protein uS19 n=1 Tax=Candidatus Argoarchaeum ethanivorans TaxID=2608793 RepID=A0A811T3T9_9EURY|nr:MAG: 30S ribosomal protein S19 [Candidatus Argoarchaeum ethanivorans]
MRHQDKKLAQLQQEEPGRGGDKVAKKSSTRLPKRKGEFTYRGKTIEELKKLSIEEFAELVNSRTRRSLKRGLSTDEKKLLEKIRGDKTVRTHLRQMIILPEMVNKKVMVHSGKEFKSFEILPEMLGHCFGEYAPTRRLVKHGSAGVGATKSSKFVPLK